MSRPKSSWGGIIAAGSSTITALQMRKSNRHTRKLIDMVEKNDFNEERRHKEQMLATLLASEQTKEAFVHELNNLNREFSFSINRLSAEMREISKSNWSILEHLETRKAEREYEGKMFHLISTLMDDLDDFSKISSEFPEYVLVRANAWDELFSSLDFGLEKFAQMEDSRKYDRARKVFNHLAELIDTLTDVTQDSDVDALDQFLANHQEDQNRLSKMKESTLREESELQSLNEQLKLETNKTIPSAPEIDLLHSELHKQQVGELDEKINNLDSKINELEKTLNKKKRIPVEIKSLLSEISRLSFKEQELSMDISSMKKPSFFSSRADKEKWKSIREQKLSEFSVTAEKLDDMKYTKAHKLCIRHQMEYDEETNSVIHMPSKLNTGELHNLVDQWNVLKSERRSLIDDFNREQGLQAQKFANHLKSIDSRNEKIASLEELISDKVANIAILDEKIERLEKNFVATLLEHAHFLPATYLVIEDQLSET